MPPRMNFPGFSVLVTDVQPDGKPIAFCQVAIEPVGRAMSRSTLPISIFDEVSHISIVRLPSAARWIFLNSIGCVAVTAGTEVRLLVTPAMGAAVFQKVILPVRS